MRRVLEEKTKEEKLKKAVGEKLGRFLARNLDLGSIEELPIINGRLACEASFPSILTWLREKLCQKKEEVKPAEEVTATELLRRVGYKIYGDFKCAKDYAHFKKYYARGEKLCKFNDEGRADKYHIFFIVKNGAENLRREDFNGKENRQDEYGVSVLSIDVAKDGQFIKICNRYNHGRDGNITGADNAFGSNLDNIAEGLTAAFEKEFNVKIPRNVRREEVEGAITIEVGGKPHLYFYEKETNDYFVSERFQNYVKAGNFYQNPKGGREKFILIDNLLVNIENPAESVNLVSGALFLNGVSVEGVKIHSSLEAALKAEKREPNLLHVVKPAGGDGC